MLRNASFMLFRIYLIAGALMFSGIGGNSLQAIALSFMLKDASLLSLV